MLWAPFGFGLVKEWLAGGRKNNNKVFFLNKNELQYRYSISGRLCPGSGPFSVHIVISFAGSVSSAGFM